MVPPVTPIESSPLAAPDIPTPMARPGGAATPDLSAAAVPLSSVAAPAAEAVAPAPAAAVESAGGLGGGLGALNSLFSFI